MMSLLPLIIASVFATFGTLWFLREKSRVQFVCENGVLKTQEILVEAENRLLKLNLVAEALILRKRQLIAAILIAPTPFERSLLISKLEVILQRMRTLRQMQLSIVRLAEAKAAIEDISLYQNFIRISAEWKKSWQSAAFSVALVSPAKIKLQAVFNDEMLPVYTVPKNFARLQTQTATFSVFGKTLFPRWMTFLFSQKMAWQETCSSHPELKENLWKSQIGMAKS